MELALEVIAGPATGAVVPMTDEVIIGRAGPAAIADPSIEPHHVLVRRTIGGASVVQLAGRARILADRRPVGGSAHLALGGELELGNTRCRLVAARRQVSSAAEGPQPIVSADRCPTVATFERTCRLAAAAAAAPAPEVPLGLAQVRVEVPVDGDEWLTDFAWLAAFERATIVECVVGLDGTVRRVVVVDRASTSIATSTADRCVVTAAAAALTDRLTGAGIATHLSRELRSEGSPLAHGTVVIEVLPSWRAIVDDGTNRTTVHLSVPAIPTVAPRPDERADPSRSTPPHRQVPRGRMSAASGHRTRCNRRAGHAVGSPRRSPRPRRRASQCG